MTEFLTCFQDQAYNPLACPSRLALVLAPMKSSG